MAWALVTECTGLIENYKMCVPMYSYMYKIKKRCCQDKDNPITCEL